MERWIVISGTDEKILVSDLGRVRSVLRNDCVLSLQPDKKGYLRVSVTISRIKHTFKVHREVAKAFIPNPLGLDQVNHIDGNKQNNCVSNLEWVSNYENAQHAIKTGLWGGVFAASKRVDDSRKIPVLAVNDTTGESVRFESISDAEKHFSSRHICDALKGKMDRVRGFSFYYTGGDAACSQ